MGNLRKPLSSNCARSRSRWSSEGNPRRQHNLYHQYDTGSVSSTGLLLADVATGRGKVNLKQNQIDAVTHKQHHVMSFVFVFN